MAPTQDPPATASDTVSGPTVLFWMVCFALNAMSTPSGSVCGLGHRPHWILRMSPIMPLFDGLHIVVTWCISFHQSGKSYRNATAETLLNRLSGGSVPFEYLATMRARDDISRLPTLAARIHSLIPSNEDETDLPRRDLEQARDTVKRLFTFANTADKVFNRIVNGNLAVISAPPPLDWIADSYDKTLEPVEIIDTLISQTSDIETVLGQLIVSADSAKQKERIRTTVAPYKFCLHGVKHSLRAIDSSRDISKARGTLRDLLAQWRFRWLCFALGVLPQLMKLFSSSGLWGAKFCGAGYLFLAVVFECLIFAGRGFGLHTPQADAWVANPMLHKRDDRIQGRAYSTTVGFGSVPGSESLHLQFWSTFVGMSGLIGHVTICLYLMAGMQPLGESPQPQFWVKYGTLIVFPIWISQMRVFMHFFGSDGSHGRAMGATQIFIFMGAAVLSLLRMLLRVGDSWVRGESPAGVRYFFMLLSTCVILRISSGLFRIDQKASSMAVNASRILFCGVPLAYYFLVRYREEGTAIPDWTKWLG